LEIEQGYTMIHGHPIFKILPLVIDNLQSMLCTSSIFAAP